MDVHCYRCMRLMVNWQRELGFTCSSCKAAKAIKSSMWQRALSLLLLLLALPALALSSGPNGPNTFTAHSSQSIWGDIAAWAYHVFTIVWGT